MDMLTEKIKETTSFLINEGFTNPSVGVVLGSGLGAFAEMIKIEKKLSYSDIPNFPVATVEFHKGHLVYGTIGEKKVIVMLGRFHFYEGYSMQQITFPVRVMKELGASVLLLSNAAGGMNKKFTKGDLVLIKDHINLHPGNPLTGLNDVEFGNRFVDMSEPYDADLSRLFKATAKEMKLKLRKGVYVAVPGPNLETKAEYKYLRMIGADMVGMSTVPEVIVANHVGLKCAALCVITDECDPDNLKPVNIAEIIKVAGEADVRLSKLFEMVIERI